jgi:hypothetical protein
MRENIDAPSAPPPTTPAAGIGGLDLAPRAALPSGLDDLVDGLVGEPHGSAVKVLGFLHQVRHPGFVKGHGERLRELVLR